VRDYEKGFNWMHMAARGGNVAAQNRLAKLYVTALGTEPDPILAAAWYIVARRAGLIDREMEDYLQGLTDQQLQEAVQRANHLP
jgi:TPR repeat protein